jgi:hypothetical protein
MNSLSDSIEALYSAFGDVPKPRNIKGCPCCIERKKIGTLLSKPLRELSPDDLSSYASSAFLTVGEQADYLYFLPRIIEITCTESGWWPDPEVTGRAIADAQIDKWPPQRRDALIHVLHAVIQAALGYEDGAWLIDQWICAISKMGLEVAPFLRQIEASPAHVLAYYEDNSQPLMKQRLGNSFWDCSDRGYEEVIAWFKSPKITKIILDGYGLPPNNSQRF